MPDDKLSFRMWRRRVVEQIMARKAVDLPPIAKLTAHSIAERLHDVTRVTPASSATIGRPVGLRPDEAQYGIDALVAIGHSRVKRHDNGTRYIRLMLRDDTDAPYVPVIADSAFFKTPAYMAFLSGRARFIADLFADHDVSPTDKVVAFGSTRFIEVESGNIDQTFRAIGTAVGYGPEAVRKSIGRLVTAGWFSKDRAPGRKTLLTPAFDSGMGSGMDSGMGSGMGNSGNADSTAISSPISRDSSTDSDSCFT
jgi:hypothetical protein